MHAIHRTVTGVVLAAGASTRMGYCKALLPARADRAFLTTLVDTFSNAGITSVVAIVGHHAEEVRHFVRRSGLTITLVENPDPSRGQLSSLLVALALPAVASSSAILFTPVDYPTVDATTVRRLVETWRETDALIVRPTNGHRHGHPVLLDARLFAELRAADPSVGARAVVRAHAADSVDIAVDDAGAFDDIDTPDDYRRVFGVDPPT